MDQKASSRPLCFLAPSRDSPPQPGWERHSGRLFCTYGWVSSVWLRAPGGRLKTVPEVGGSIPSPIPSRTDAAWQRRDEKDWKYPLSEYGEPVGRLMPRRRDVEALEPFRPAGSRLYSLD